MVFRSGKRYWLRIAGVGLYIAGVCTAYSCSGRSRSEREVVMDSREFLSAVKSLNVENDKQIDSLAGVIKKQAREHLSALIEMLHSGNAQDVRRARALILNLDDLPFQSLLDSPPPDSAGLLVWDLQTAVDIHMGDQSKLTQRLISLLDDKCSVPQPPVPPEVEEKPIPRRVCDEAYLMLRKMLSSESSEDFMANADIFIRDMTDRQRDRAIEEFKKTKQWLSLQEKMQEYLAME
jgi:hypothetical protein